MSITRLQAPTSELLGEAAELDNRRSAPRLNRQFGIRYQATGEAEAESVALNISATGARILLHGATAWPALTLDLGENLRLQAQTVWEHPLEGGHGRIVGVQFSPLGAEQQDALLRLLSRLAA